MSFRRRDHVILANSAQPSLVNRHPALPHATTPIAQPAGTTRPSTPNITSPFTKPSPISSHLSISTGTPDLDGILLHNGLPLGHSLIVHESSSTDFATVLVRAYVSQSVLHNRIPNHPPSSHCILIGVDPNWLRSLPGPVPAKRSSSASPLPPSNPDMKIAWRYGLNNSGQVPKPADTAHPHYSHSFDISLRINPSPQDISYVPLSPTAQAIVSHVRQIIKAHPNCVIRIAIPNLLHPSLYPPQCASGSFIGPLLHSLRSLLRQHPQSLLLMATLLLDLFPQECAISHLANTLFDAAIHLQPFGQDMLALLDRAYKNDPSRQHHGLVHILKLPVVADRGVNTVRTNELAFRNSKRHFAIEPWGIPVEDVPDLEAANTAQPIDF